MQENDEDESHVVSKLKQYATARLVVRQGTSVAEFLPFKLSSRVRSRPSHLICAVLRSIYSLYSIRTQTEACGQTSVTSHLGANERRNRFFIEIDHQRTGSCFRHQIGHSFHAAGNICVISFSCRIVSSSMRRILMIKTSKQKIASSSYDFTNAPAAVGFIYQNYPLFLRD